MPLSFKPAEGPLERTVIALIGVTLLACAALATDFAVAHMKALAAICGGSAPHCGWCYAAAGFGLAGLSAMGFALRPARRAVRARR